MVRHRKRKTSIGQVPSETMRNAVTDVITRGSCMKVAATQHKISYHTLRRYVRKARQLGAEALEGLRMAPNYAVRKIFTEEAEKSIARYLRTCANMCYGLTTVDTRRLAYTMAVQNRVKIPESWTKNKLAGEDWMRSFAARHKLSLRQPEGCSLSRMTSFNKANVSKFFENLGDLYERIPALYDPSKIWNLDETGTSTVPDNQPKIYTTKGVKQVSSATSGERGTLVTTCSFINAAGGFIPPVMIFPRKNFKNIMVSGAPYGTKGLANPSGWINSDTFPEAMQHFVEKTGASKDKPVLLLLDNHESHLSIDAIDIAKNNGVHMLTIPPHSSDKLQPLDITVHGPFKKFYSDAVRSKMLTHPGVPITIYEIASCVGIAHAKAMTPNNIMNGFKSAGIYPSDKNIFTDDDFQCSAVTDRPNPEQNPAPIANNHTAGSENPVPGTSTEGQINSSENPAPIANNHTASSENPVPGTSTEGPANSSKANPPATPSGSVSKNLLVVSPEEIRPYPKAQPRKTNRKPREKGRSLIPTDTPEKRRLEEKIAERAAKKLKKGKGRSLRAKKSLFQEPELPDEFEEDVDRESDEDLTEDDDENVTEDEEDDCSEPDICDSFFSGKLPHPLVKDEYVLVEFSDEKKKTKFYYIGQYSGKIANDGAFEINFLRKSAKLDNTFIFPPIQDLPDVVEADIKMIMPQPVACGTTSRLQNRIKFEISFSSIDVR